MLMSNDAVFGYIITMDYNCVLATTDTDQIEDVMLVQSGSTGRGLIVRPPEKSTCSSDPLRSKTEGGEHIAMPLLPRAEELLTTDKARGATGHQPGKKHPPRFLFDVPL